MRVAIWGPGGENTQWLSVASDDMGSLIDGFRGCPMRESWTPLKVSLETRSESGRELVSTDFPSLHFSGEAVSRAAGVRCADYLESFGELLPLDSTGDFFAYNVTTLVDALDLEASDVTFFADGQRLMMIREHVFLPGSLRDAGIFKLPQYARGTVFLTDEAVETLCACGVGFDARYVWAEP
jgi:hypothetical protein